MHFVLAHSYRRLVALTAAVVVAASFAGTFAVPASATDPYLIARTLGSGLNQPEGVAAIPGGGVYVADYNNNRVVRIAENNTVTLIAGGTFPTGFSGDGGPATQAVFAGPSGVALDSAGALYVADPNNRRVRRIGTDGYITTIAGGGALAPAAGQAATDTDLAYPYSVATAGSKVAVSNRTQILMIDPETGLIDAIRDPGDVNSITGDAVGNVACVCAGRVKLIEPDGTTTNIAGAADSPFVDGMPAIEANLAGPLQGIAFAPDGSIYVDTWRDSRKVFRINPDRTIYRVAGGGTNGGAANTFSARQDARELSIAHPQFLAVSPEGLVYLGVESQPALLEFKVPTPRSAATLQSDVTAQATSGQPITSHATLTGNHPTGYVLFSVYGPNDATCSASFRVLSSTVALTGGQATSPANFRPTAPGSYRWVISYEGDELNEPAATVCDQTGQTSTIIPAPVVVGTTVSADTAKATLQDPQRVTLKAHLTRNDTNAALANMAIEFTARGQSLCTANTDSVGTATCVVSTQPVRAAGGYDATFNGATGFSGSTGSAQFQPPLPGGPLDLLLRLLFG